MRGSRHTRANRDKGQREAYERALKAQRGGDDASSTATAHRDCHTCGATAGERCRRQAGHRCAAA